MVKASDNTANTSSNTCLNSLADMCRGIEARAYHIIDASEVELKPCEIARIIHSGKKPKDITPGQYTTVRVVCAKLLQKGLVVQPYPGAYCNKITYGVRFVPLCVHNISLRSFVCQDVKSWEKDEFVGGVKIHVCFGSERRKISGYIACDVGGMSHDACMLALHRWFDIAEGRLGFALADLELLTFEFNKDYHGVRIDGVQCITKTDLLGIIDRTYQKEEDVIRRERKFTKSMSVNKFEQEIRKGTFEIEKSQERYELQQEVKRNSEALKFTNSRLLQMEKMQEATFTVLVKINEALTKLGDVEGDPGRLVDGQKKQEEYAR